MFPTKIHPETSTQESVLNLLSEGILEAVLELSSEGLRGQTSGSTEDSGKIAVPI